MAMAMACMRALVISILFLASIRLPMVTAAVSSGGYQFELIHVDANGNFSREQLIRRALDRARLRAAMLSGEDEDDTAVSGSFSFPVQYSPKSYVMELKMGSTVPETTMLAVADTGSDLIWTNQLKDCIGNPSFTPTNVSCSEAYGKEKDQRNTCMVSKTYGNGKTMKGLTGNETVALPAGTKKEVALVCAIEWSQKMLPEAGHGVVGLNRGRMSLVNQLEVTEFSYCLRDPLKPTLRSPLWLGGNAQSAAGGSVGWRTTELVEISVELSQQREWAKNGYYVALDKICINDKCRGPLKQDDFWLKSSDGGKGLMLVDSGNTYTQLDSKIFEELKNVLREALDVEVEIKNKMNCFNKAPKEDARKPDLVLKFPGADLEIPWASYVEENEHGFCLYILDKGPSILGSFQQHNVAMLYDLGKKELSFKRVDGCSSTN